MVAGKFEVMTAEPISLIVVFLVVPPWTIGVYSSPVRDPTVGGRLRIGVLTLVMG
jgi:hypothetical protein